MDIGSNMLEIGTKIVKTSRKPFKSGDKIGTVDGYAVHPVTNKQCYVLKECGSIVEAFRCKKLES